MASARGRCLCGAITFGATGVAFDHPARHCGMCRRWASGPLMATPGGHAVAPGRAEGAA